MSEQNQREISYELTEDRGWCSVIEDKREPATELTAPFLPIMLEFLRRRPRLDKPVGIVLQSRGLDGDCVGTVMTLQELPNTRGEAERTERLRQLAPAVYARSKKCVQASRINAVIRDLQTEDVEAALEKARYCYDLVLRLRDVDDILGVKSSRLTAKVEPILPHPIEMEMITGVWLPCERKAIEYLGRCVSIPWVPPHSRFDPSTNSVVYVLAGETAHLNLRNIHEVWQRPGIRNLLIAAEPGSGKEIAARLLHQGRARGRFTSASVAGEEWDTWRIPLLGEGLPGGATVLRGLIEDTIVDGVGGTVLVDEIDKAKESIRQALLRIIESDECRRPGNAELIRFVGDQRPLFVFTGSGQGLNGAKIENEKMTVVQRIRTETPKDFWQRIDWTLKIENPIKGNEIQSVPVYIALFMERTWAKDRNDGPRIYATDRLLERDRAVIDQRVREHWILAIITLYELLKSKSWENAGNLRIIRTAAEETARRLSKTARVESISEDAVKRITDGAVEMACMGM